MVRSASLKRLATLRTSAARYVLLVRSVSSESRLDEERLILTDCASAPAGLSTGLVLSYDRPKRQPQKGLGYVDHPSNQRFPPAFPFSAGTKGSANARAVVAQPAALIEMN